MLEQRAGHLMRPHITQRHLHVQVFDGGRAELAQRRCRVALLQAQALEFAIQQLAPVLFVAGPVQFVEPVAHLLPRAGAGQVAVGRLQPVAPGLGGLASEDFHPVAAGQRMGQRHDPAVDLGPAAAVPDHGVHVVGEIQRRGPVRQVDHLAHRGQGVDAVLDQLGVQRACQRSVLPALLVRVQQPAHPLDLALQRRIARAALLVAPVRGHAQLGLLVHLEGADLHFQVLAFRSHHRGVQGAVIVALGAGNVVVELAGDGSPQRVHHAQGRIAGRNIVHQHAHGAQIVELAEGNILGPHLLPDAVNVLGPSGDLAAHALGGQCVGQLLLHLLDEAFAGAALVGQQRRDATVGLRLQVAERQVFQFPLELPDAQPVGQRSMDVTGQPGQRNALRFRCLGRHAHPRQLLGQQDRHHPQVAHDRQQQAPQALLVAAAAALGVQVPHLAAGLQAIDQRMDPRVLPLQRRHQRRRPVPGGEHHRGTHHLGIRIEPAQRFQRVREQGQRLPQDDGLMPRPGMGLEQRAQRRIERGRFRQPEKSLQRYAGVGHRLTCFNVRDTLTLMRSAEEEQPMPRLRLLIVAVALACAAPAMAQQGIQQQMSADEFRAAGLDKLSAAELANLDRWLQRQVQEEASVAVEQAVEQGREEGREQALQQVQAGGPPLPAPPATAVNSTLSGNFNGFARGQRYTLENGQVWEQTDAARLEGVRLDNPQVVISPGMFGTWYLRIEGYNTRAKVRRVQ